MLRLMFSALFSNAILQPTISVASSIHFAKKKSWIRIQLKAMNTKNFPFGHIWIPKQWIKGQWKHHLVRGQIWTSICWPRVFDPLFIICRSFCCSPHFSIDVPFHSIILSCHRFSSALFPCSFLPFYSQLSLIGVPVYNGQHNLNFA